VQPLDERLVRELGRRSPELGHGETLAASPDLDEALDDAYSFVVRVESRWRSTSAGALRSTTASKRSSKRPWFETVPET
jgi:hypothetical protein